MIHVFDSNLNATTSGDAVAGLSARLVAAGGLGDGTRFSDAVREREQTMSTWLGHGVALPHARTGLARSLALAVGRSPAGIPWPHAQQSARLIVLVAVPPAAVSEYLFLVRTIMKALGEPGRRGRLLAAGSDEDLREAWEAALK